VAVLATVAGVAVNKSDKAAQQVAGTGQSLMESQRLAKSVSQALVGSAQAFPDVKESADVLARTVRGLRSGDEALRLLRDGLHPCLILVDQMRAVAGGASFGSQQSADPEWATIPTLEITPRSNLDKLSRVLKTHCINNHRVG